MDDPGTDNLQCEEQLRSTLHCDDKEKLRRKLLYLQREYHRTAQRLQRAERSEAVQRNVSRIAWQGREEGTASPRLPASLSSTNDVTCGGHTESDKPRSQAVRFLSSLEAACLQTSHSVRESATGHRPSPSLRLRSRRSRLRWERQSSVVGASTDSSQDGQEQNERLGPAATQTTRADEIQPTEVVDESEELLSGGDSESPSLLLTRSSVPLRNEARDVGEQARQDGPGQRDKEIKGTVASPKETQSLLLTCKSEIRSDDTGRAETQSESEKAGLEANEDGQTERLLKGGNKTADAFVEDGRQCEKDDENTVKGDETSVGGGEWNTKGVGLLDSCTLVEGLLFPAEYYVRTTRRMTSSHSQPDMQAVILSQLNMGRQRRSRANARRLPHSGGSSTQPSDSLGPCSKPQGAEMSAETHGQGSSENSGQTPPGNINSEARLSAAVSTPRPARGGRKRRRGRGRGRPDTPRCSFSPDTRPLEPVHTSDNPQLTSSPFLLSPLLGGATVSPSPSLCAADQPEPLLTGAVPDDKHHLLTPSTAAEHLAPGETGNKDSPASGHPLYPIFLKGSSRRNSSSQQSASQGSSQSLVVPSPPAPTSLPLPSLSLSSFVKSLVKFDIPQDFHLPDDQFASLKLHKIRQIALETGVEAFSSSSYCTRRSVHRYVFSHSSSDTSTPLPVPFDSTPTVSSSPKTTEVEHTSTLSAEEQNTLVAPDTTDLPDPGKAEGPRAESQGHAASTESADRGRAADSVDQRNEDEAELTDCPGDLRPGETQGVTDHTDEGALPQTPSFSSGLRGTVEEPPESSRASLTDTSAGSARSPAEETKKGSEPDTSPDADTKDETPSVHHSVQSQLLLSPRASALLTTPQPLPSSAPPSSPTLPSLGVTPQPAPAAPPLTSSPAAPTLALPPPHSPSTQALPPPPLSPCPPRPLLPPSRPLAPTAPQVKASCELVRAAEPANEAHASAVFCEGKAGLNTQAAEEDLQSRTHTLKSPSGGCLVDACCLPGPSGRLCVAAAGKWAVCLWTQTSASDWGLLHTWSFNEMVISVFPVPDADGLICVTLGQLEIREVRILSCCGLSQVTLCGGSVQTVVGASTSRVVTSSHSASGSALVVYMLSNSGRPLSSQPLVSPGVCVGALSPVHGLPDALIGTDESERLFIWNLSTGQLLQKVLLGEGFSHTACLRGYSSCGVLFVLLQHPFLSSHEGGEEVPVKEGRTPGLLSLVAVNPLSGKSIPASCLRPPSAWSGRLCEVDVDGRSVVGLSQNGCVCVWELGRRGAARTVRAPESEGWQLARWGGGGGGTLLTGHHNGDVTLHCFDSVTKS